MGSGHYADSKTHSQFSALCGRVFIHTWITLEGRGREGGREGERGLGNAGMVHFITNCLQGSLLNQTQQLPSELTTPLTAPPLPRNPMAAPMITPKVCSCVRVCACIVNAYCLGISEHLG